MLPPTHWAAGYISGAYMVSGTKSYAKVPCLGHAVLEVGRVRKGRAQASGIEQHALTLCSLICRTPSPRLARWPLGWVWQALKFPDSFYATHTGMDTLVYVRFLRACSEYSVHPGVVPFLLA